MSSCQFREANGAQNRKALAQGTCHPAAKHPHPPSIDAKSDVSVALLAVNTSNFVITLDIQICE
jgi:hypothetical protein